MASELSRVESADYRQVGPGDALANLTRPIPQLSRTARYLPDKHANAMLTGLEQPEVPPEARAAA